jgi:hypothetical protein
MKKRRIQIFFESESANYIEAESVRKNVSQGEIARELVEIGLAHKLKKRDSGNVFDALQIFKDDLLADLRRVIPTPSAPQAPTPSPSVVTQTIDISELRNDLITEIRRTVATAQTAQPKQPALPIQLGPENEKIWIALEQSTKQISDSNKLLEQFVSIAKEQFANVDKTCAAVDALTAKPSPAPGITREEFAQFVELVRGEITDNRKFQQAAIDYIGQSMTDLKATVGALADGKSGNAETVLAQISALETKVRAMFSIVIEGNFYLRQYGGVSLQKTVGENELGPLLDDIKQLWKEEQKRLNGLV